MRTISGGNKEGEVTGHRSPGNYLQVTDHWVTNNQVKGFLFLTGYRSKAEIIFADMAMVQSINL